MRKLFCAAALLGAIVLCGCDVNEMSSLRDLSHPYAAEYKCRALTLGGEDLLPQFEFLKLTLGYDGTYRLFSREKEGGESEFSGNYAMEEDRVVLSSRAGGKTRSFAFPYRDGAIKIVLLYGGKPLCATFSAAD